VSQRRTHNAIDNRQTTRSVSQRRTRNAIDKKQRIEAVSQRRTHNAIDKRQRIEAVSQRRIHNALDNRQTIVFKRLHRKVKIGQYESSKVLLKYSCHEITEILLKAALSTINQP
jgi:hypothetical protein